MTEVPSPSPSPVDTIRFVVAAHAAWAPGRETDAAWKMWASGLSDAVRAEAAEPSLPEMPAMLRRRASPSGKMALQAAYRAIAAQSAPIEIPTVFCSRHGECGRSAILLADLANAAPMSPTAFSLSVHNATAGLFSIARGDRSNSLALAAGTSTVEHAAIEAGGLLADGAAAVLLVVADSPLPSMYQHFADCDDQPFGWAWLLQSADIAANSDTINLSWSAHASAAEQGAEPTLDSAVKTAVKPDTDLNVPSESNHHAESGGLQIMRFFLSGDRLLLRQTNGPNGHLWRWSRDDQY